VTESPAPAMPELFTWEFASDPSVVGRRIRVNGTDGYVEIVP